MFQRRLSASATALAADWYDKPIQKIPVSVRGRFTQTEDGACEVALHDGTIAFVKPRQDKQKKLMVAREKIAADLGHVFDLPVAPVVVRKPEGGDWPFYSAMSLACLNSPREWKSSNFEGAKSAYPALDCLKVFWTWIGDRDHQGNHGNLLYQSDGTDCVVLAIDHARSLCHSNTDDPLYVPVCCGYIPEKSLLDVDGEGRALAAAILSEGMLHSEKIVLRLGEILTNAEQETILNILSKRIQLLCSWGCT